ncbi:hypothetical protein A2U01_0100962, partial [Trifolium medium]|nr:hypothetical protein [Trifolium medium]
SPEVARRGSGGRQARGGDDVASCRQLLANFLLLGRYLSPGEPRRQDHVKLVCLMTLRASKGL